MCATGSGKRSSNVTSSTARASTSYRRCAVGTSCSRIAANVSGEVGCAERLAITPTKAVA